MREFNKRFDEILKDTGSKATDDEVEAYSIELTNILIKRFSEWFQNFFPETKDDGKTKLIPLFSTQEEAIQDLTEYIKT